MLLNHKTQYIVLYWAKASTQAQKRQKDEIRDATMDVRRMWLESSGTDSLVLVFIHPLKPLPYDLFVCAYDSFRFLATDGSALPLIRVLGRL